MRFTAVHLFTLVVVLAATVTAQPQDLTGAHGAVITNGDSDPSLNTSGVVLRAKTSRSSIAAQLGSSDGSFVVFTASSAALLRVQADGKTGIGTPAPRAILHLVRNNGAGIGPELILENNGGTISNASALTFSSEGFPCCSKRRHP
ncbi:MAG TPA: hypothetical protein VEO54_00770 [Thermoanaerobaculia bacterium]|nr:hypothetical protein [Thermoanaerobaculia bacterium]